jgi:hypothetical protein
MRQQADTAREQQKIERRQDNMKEARTQINIYLSQGMDRNYAVNAVLDSGNKMSITDKKKTRKAFQYGCHTIYSMAEGLSDINSQNSLDLVVEAI